MRRIPTAHLKMIKAEIAQDLEAALTTFPRTPGESLERWFDRVYPTHREAPEYDLAHAFGLAEGANVSMLGQDFEDLLEHCPQEGDACPPSGAVHGTLASVPRRLDNREQPGSCAGVTGGARAHYVPKADPELDSCLRELALREEFDALASDQDDENDHFEALRRLRDAGMTLTEVLRAGIRVLLTRAGGP